jgi:hypothetical protein
MSIESPTYQSYLLRLWRADGDDEPIWRAALEDTLSGERYGFATVEALVGFLRELAGQEGVERKKATVG